MTALLKTVDRGLIVAFEPSGKLVLQKIALILRTATMLTMWLYKYSQQEMFHS